METRIFWTLERIEEGIAILENPDGNRQRLSQEVLPADCKEGDFLFLSDHNSWVIDREATENARLENSKRMKSLFQKR